MKNFKSLLLITIIYCSIQGVCNGQVTFSHSLGGAYYYSSSTTAPSVLYSPRINFLELDREITISAGTHLGLGMVYNSRSGANSYALDLPLVAEINFGHGAHKDTRSHFGGFAGLGYGISKIGSAGEYGSNYNDASGPLLNGGIRALINGLPLGLRLSYLFNTKEGFGNVAGVGIFYTFGF